MFSPYVIVFSSKSKFNEVSDFDVIAKAEDTILKLGDVYEKRIFSTDLEVAAILLEIKEPI